MPTKASVSGPLPTQVGYELTWFIVFGAGLANQLPFSGIKPDIVIGVRDEIKARLIAREALKVVDSADAF